jgi:S1-C subfamily serine protease
VRIALNLGEGVEGVIVRQVEPGGWAALAGIRPGVIIMRVGPVETPSTADFEEALSEAAEAQPSEIPVFARAGARTGFFRLQPRWDASE